MICKTTIIFLLILSIHSNKDQSTDGDNKSIATKCLTGPKFVEMMKNDHNTDFQSEYENRTSKYENDIVNYEFIKINDKQHLVITVPKNEVYIEKANVIKEISQEYQNRESPFIKLIDCMDYESHGKLILLFERIDNMEKKP